MSKLYFLNIDSENYSVFYQEKNTPKETFFNLYSNWGEIELKSYQPIKMKIYKSDTGKKNFKMDIGEWINLLILSEKAVNVLKEILDDTGQIIPIITDSKRKKFYGFYPNKKVYGDEIVNLEESERVSINTVLNSNYPKDDYMFVTTNNSVRIFVNEKFKELVEKHDLKGLDFSREVVIKD